MALLNLALPTIFLHEGGYVNNPNDPGGATNYGISLRFLISTGDLDSDGLPDGDIDSDGDIDAEDIKKLLPKDAAKLYDHYWWSKHNYGEIADQAIATKVFDLAINMGAKAAHKCLQKAINQLNPTLLEVDGIFGKQTLAATNMSDPVKLLSAIKDQAANYYRSIKYSGAATFLKGWLNRAHSDMV
jgi:lysozyme family protein